MGGVPGSGTDPVLRFLVNEDVKGRVRFTEEYGRSESPDGYVSTCVLCLDIRKYRVSREDSDEGNPEEFYDHVD